MQTFSVRARAAIFVHLGAGGALKMCVRVYTNFLLRTCADVRRTSAPPFFYRKILKSIKFRKKKLKKKNSEIFFLKNVRVRVWGAGQKLVCGCVRKHY